MMILFSSRSPNVVNSTMALLIGILKMVMLF
jgi:hypothetical protein